MSENIKDAGDWKQEIIEVVRENALDNFSENVPSERVYGRQLYKNCIDTDTTALDEIIKEALRLAEEHRMKEHNNREIYWANEMLDRDEQISRIKPEIEELEGKLRDFITRELLICNRISKSTATMPEF